MTEAPAPPPAHPTPPTDPTLIRRARIAHLTDLGKRLGYGLFGLAVVVFVVGAVRGFESAEVTAVVALMAAGSVVLAPAIVFGYGVRAAEREDRETAARRRPPDPRPGSVD